MITENKLNEIAKFLPPVQLAHIKKHVNLYTEEISRLCAIIPTIPKIGESKTLPEPKVYLHYFFGNYDYYIYEFDGDDTFFGKVQIGGFPDDSQCRKFSLSNLISNQFLELEIF